MSRNRRLNDDLVCHLNTYLIDLQTRDELDSLHEPPHCASNLLATHVLRWKSQLPGLPPTRTWVEHPSPSMLPLEDVVDDIRHGERHGGEVVPAAFEGAVGCTEDEWCDALLNDSPSVHW